RGIWARFIAAGLRRARLDLSLLISESELARAASRARRCSTAARSSGGSSLSAYALISSQSLESGVDIKFTPSFSCGTGERSSLLSALAWNALHDLCGSSPYPAGFQ